MARVLFIFVIAVAVVMTAMAGMALVRAGADAARGSLSEDRMPDTFRNIAFVLLILLMLGVVTGWLGAP